MVTSRETCSHSLFFTDDLSEGIGSSLAVGCNGNEYIRINSIRLYFGKLTAAFFIFGIFGGNVFGYGIGKCLGAAFIGKPETRKFYAGIRPVGYVHCRIGHSAFWDYIVFGDIFIGYFCQVLVIHFLDDTGNDGIGSQIGIGIFAAVLIRQQNTDNDGGDQGDDRYGDNGK